LHYKIYFLAKTNTPFDLPLRKFGIKKENFGLPVNGLALARK
jgi:hypothetical protein